MKITFEEKKKMFVNKNKSINGKIGRNKRPDVAGNGEMNDKQNEYSSIDVAADIHLAGKEEPTRPELVYYKNDNDINGLINMRLENDNHIISQSYTFKCSKTMKKETAESIDAVLKKMKLAGNATVSSEAEYADRTSMEYLIEF